jgi:hypothetical protein
MSVLLRVAATAVVVGVAADAIVSGSATAALGFVGGAFLGYWAARRFRF